MKKRIKYVLASGSPRRKELLKLLIEDFEIIVSDVEENTEKVLPEDIVMDLSTIKAAAVFEDCIKSNVFEEYDAFVVIGADTIVSYNGEILGKPADENEAKDMLGLLSERTHQVFTGVTVLIREGNENRKIVFSECTNVTFRKLDKFDIEEYVASGDPLDKAGAYGIQGEFAKHVKSINGEYNNVVGLPVSRLYSELRNEKVI